MTTTANASLPSKSDSAGGDLADKVEDPLNRKNQTDESWSSSSFFLPQTEPGMSLRSSQTLRFVQEPTETSSQRQQQRSSFMALAPQKLQSNSLVDFTINKLDFKSLGLVGRESEMATLQRCLNRAATSTATKKSRSSLSGNVAQKQGREAEEQSNNNHEDDYDGDYDDDDEDDDDDLRISELENPASQESRSSDDRLRGQETSTTTATFTKPTETPKKKNFLRRRRWRRASVPSDSRSVSPALSSSSLHGTEVKKKKEKKARITNTRTPRQVILVSGAGGTGKTKLVNAAIQDYLSKQQQSNPKGNHQSHSFVQNRALWVQGKFEEDCRSHCSSGDGQKQEEINDKVRDSQQPFSGIIQACNEICSAIAKNNLSTKTTFLHSLRQTLESELPLFRSMIPAFDQVMVSVIPEEKEEIEVFSDPIADSNPGANRPRASASRANTRGSPPSHKNHELEDSKTRPLPSPVQSTSTNNALSRRTPAPSEEVILSSMGDFQNRLFYAFVRFLQFLTSEAYFTPLIMVLDDLQWADPASLELFQYLATHSNIMSPQFVLVGIYRSNHEQNLISDHDDITNNGNESKLGVFARTLHRLRRHYKENQIEHSARDMRDISITEIHLKNLELDDVQLILEKLLGFGIHNDGIELEQDCATGNSETFHQSLPTVSSPFSIPRSSERRRSSFVSKSSFFPSLSALAQVCFKKTNGNVFFLLQYLSMLREQNLLIFNLGAMAWTWDVAEIEANTMACDNVLDLLRSKMNWFFSQHMWLADILKLAACLGSTFDVPILHLVWAKYQQSKQRNRSEMEEQQDKSAGMHQIADGEGDEVDKEQDADDLKQQLEHGLNVLEHEGILMDTTNSSAAGNSSDLESAHDPRLSHKTHARYSWVHDKIREAAIVQVPDVERCLFGYHVGEILYSQLDIATLRDSSSSLLFVTVNLLNIGQKLMASNALVESDYRLRMLKNKCGKTINGMQLAHLNYLACQKAISVSAFHTAAEYVSEGIQLLPANAWEDHYELTLNLYSTGAILEGFLGNFETLELYREQVLSQEKKPLEDKLNVYCAWIDSSVYRGFAPDAVDLSLEVLGKFKCRLPRNKILVGFGLLNMLIQIKISSKSLNYDKMNAMTNTTRLQLMKFMDKLHICMYMTEDYRSGLVTLKQLQWTAKFGYCEYSPIALASAGVILACLLDDLQAGMKFGEHALVLSKKTKNSFLTAARTMLVVYSLIFSWTKPVRELLKPLLEAYDVGLKSGDTESSMWSIYNWLVCKFMCGSSLDILEADSFTYMKQMDELKRIRQHFVCKPMRQAFLNLLGRNNSENPTSMVGDEISWDQYENNLHDSFYIPIIHGWEGLLLTYFGHHVQHADLVVKDGPDLMARTYVGSPNAMWYTFLKGISCYAAARETGKRKYAKLGAHFRNKIKKWMAAGNPNVVHYELLLGGEALAWKGKKFLAINKYKTAILLAARSGYQHDAALACERLALYNTCKELNDPDEVRYQLQNAIRYWRSWGAVAKVKDIETRYSTLLP